MLSAKGRVVPLTVVIKAECWGVIESSPVLRLRTNVSVGHYTHVSDLIPAGELRWVRNSSLVSYICDRHDILTLVSYLLCHFYISY